MFARGCVLRLGIGNERVECSSLCRNGLAGIFDKLTGRGACRTADVDAAMREVRRALIEADVALEVVRSFIDKVKAQGGRRRRSSNRSRPARWSSRSSMTRWSRRWASDGGGLDLKAAPPVPILMVGLQGSGKTTTTAKIAKRLKERDKTTRADGLARHAPARRAGTACRFSAQQIGVDTLADRSSRPDAARDRQARDGGSAAAAATTSSCSIPPAGCISMKS